MSQVHFRRARADDARGIAELLAAVAEELLWIGTVPPVDIDARAARIAASLTSGASSGFVLARDERIAGELTLHGVARGSIAMCLAADLRGRGFGGVLLDAALGAAVRTGRPVLDLGVYAHNRAARRLYAARGFVAVGAPTAPLRSDGETYAIIRMERLLAGAQRRAVLERVADAILAQPRARRVAIDGTDGAGKTCFADELAHVLAVRGTTVIRASADGFHHPRAIRYRRGRTSPEGFFEDSYDDHALRRVLLDPLAPGGSGRYRRAIHDVHRDAAIDAEEELAPPDAVLVVDGIFLQRDALRACWDLAVFLDVAFDVSIPRGAARDGTDPDPASAYNARYVGGHQLYFARCAPRERATIVIDNTDLHAPTIVRASPPP